MCVCLLRYKFIGYKYQKLCTAVIRRLVRINKRFKGNTRRSVYSNKIQTGQESGKKIYKQDNVSVNRKTKEYRAVVNKTAGVQRQSLKGQKLENCESGGTTRLSNSKNLRFNP